MMMKGLKPSGFRLQVQGSAQPLAAERPVKSKMKLKVYIF
jgi:hypothetical protein